MIDRQEARSHIERIREKKRNIEDLAGAMWVIEKVFVRRGHFLFEFLQNADDVEAEKMQAIISGNTLRIYNNGKPFSPEDVESICSIGRSNKDPQKYLGYLGAGFKAVFLISSHVGIYSLPYTFRFCKDEWPDPKNVPWQITPIWIEDIPSSVSSECRYWNTVFELQNIDEEGLRGLEKEFETFNPRSLLFLPHIKELILKWDGKHKIIRKVYQGENIWELRSVEGEKGETTKWVVISSREIRVPEYVRKDPLTQEWGRGEVEQRKVAFAFRLNNEGDLIEEPFGTAHFGVFSFLPLREEESGLPFLVQGDFLTGPGRDSMHREALWNIWLIKELFNLAKEEIIPYFKRQSEWRFSYTNLLYTRSTISHPLFGKFLVEPLRKELRSKESLVDIRGVFRKSEEVVEVGEQILRKLDQEALEKILEKKILDARCKDTPLEILRIRNFEELSSYFESPDVLKERLGDTWKECWKQWLEGLAEEWRRLAESTRSRSDYKRRFRWCTKIFDEQEKMGRVFPEGEIYIADEEIRKIVNSRLPGRFRLIHPCLADENILNYLQELEAKRLSIEDVKEILKRDQYPKWLKELQDPLIPDPVKIGYIKSFKEDWEKGYSVDIKGMYVKTKSGKWCKIQEVLLAKEYQPEEDIETLVDKGLLDGEYEFLNPIFIKGESVENIQKMAKFLSESRNRGGHRK